MINGRNKGKNFELTLIKKLKSLGWVKACSSRSESRNLDAAGVDVCYTDPLQIQCKAVEKNFNVHTELASMPQNGKFNLVFHKRNRLGTVVSMTEEDFFRLIKGVLC